METSDLNLNVNYNPLIQNDFLFSFLKDPNNDLNNFDFYLGGKYLGRIHSYNPLNVSFIDENKTIQSFSRYDPIIGTISIHTKSIN